MGWVVKSMLFGAVPRQNFVRRTNPRIFGRMMLSYAYTQDGVLVGGRGFDEGQLRDYLQR
jgi:hypothetical protein